MPISEHPYSDLWDQIQLIIEKYQPVQKREAYMRYYSSEVDRVFETKRTLVSIRNGIDAIPIECASTAWKNAKKAILKLIKERENEEASVFHLSNPTVIESLPCAKGLDEKVIKRLNESWDYTGKIKGADIEEHISFFINLSKKEGRGELKTKVLTGLFVGDLAEQFEKELKSHFGV